jgi:hypothetical protein
MFRLVVCGLWARSLARIKASASGAENPGFKSQRARHQLLAKRPLKQLLLMMKMMMEYFWLIEPAATQSFLGFILG